MSDSDNSEYEEMDEIDFGLLSSDDINRIRQQLSDQCAAVNDNLLSSRETVERKRLVGKTIQDLFKAFNHIATAYLSMNAVDQTLQNIKGVIRETIKNEVAAASKSSVRSFPMTYAERASNRSSADSKKVKVANGPTVTVPSTVSVVIGPKSSKDNSFDSADATRKTIMKAVNPRDLNLSVNRLVNTRNKSVRIIADKMDLEKLKASPALAAAGLEVKEREKLNPRLIIRGVPTDLTDADLLADIKDRNLTDKLRDDNSVKLVYRYPPRANSKGLASVVIESSSEVRRMLLNQGRVYLAWQSCKIEDYLRVLQCYRCQDFGHLAKTCTSAAVCGNCSGAHETSSCTCSATSVKCHNCFVNKLTNVQHKAFDVSKCPIIKRKLTEKAKNICY